MRIICLYRNSKIIENISDKNDSFSILKVSFAWYTFIGTMTVWIVGVPISYIFGANTEKSLDPNLISPVAWCLLPKRLKRMVNVKDETLKCNYLPVAGQ